MLSRAKVWLFRSSRGRIILALITLLLVFVLYQAVTLASDILDNRTRTLLRWWQGDEEERLELITVQKDTCPGAPFILPAEGYIGLLYADPRGPYSNINPHQGIDIFSNSEPGLTPVYAAYDGYITREADWASTLIQRIPEDPLNPGQQLWLYYTHMANQEGVDFIIDDIPPGTHELFVQQGTLLGFTGDYNGNSLRGVWVHLHFSIIKDDGQGNYTNELEFNNSLDPSNYLGLDLNYQITTLEGEERQLCSNIESRN
jgi:murein DD-endopeptidase MepM/ murein hydrolase activator NlpD